MPADSAPRAASPQDSNLGDDRADWVHDHLGTEEKGLLEEDSRWFFHQCLSTPCLNAVRRVEGIYLEDLSGRRYMDFHGNNVHHLGHAHPRLVAALKAQLDDLVFAPRRYTNRFSVELARTMASLAGGGLDKCLFAPSGSDAVEIALRIVRGATGRHKTISFVDSFHGAGFGASSISGDALFRDSLLGPPLPGAVHVRPPRDGLVDASLSEIREAFEREREIAAVIACPMVPSEYIPPAWFWAEVRQLCSRFGALLVFDEIPWGLGKTGAMFSWQHYGVVPDILVTGKALGGGVVPIACVSAREELDRFGGLAIGHYTHEKNPFAAAAALATIRIIQDEGLVQRAASLGELALQMAGDLTRRHHVVSDARGKGLVLGLDLRPPAESGVQPREAAGRLFYKALRRGLSAKATDGTLALSPPLVITRQELERAFDILDESLAELDAEISAGRPA
ncbi:MAG TPA: aspartate aminotransferase family protein [Spirochaetia bacterium]|nr:aspartate aminotransferase family protein [Spirochaetia bacterium]